MEAHNVKNALCFDAHAAEIKRLKGSQQVGAFL